MVIADLNEPLAQTVAASLGERAVAVKTDVSSEESVANLIATCVETFGGLDSVREQRGRAQSGLSG